MVQNKLSGKWLAAMQDEMDKFYFRELIEFIDSERKLYAVYPQKSQVFEAFRLTAFEDVKVVLVGQDPYHGMGQAHGLSFSVLSGVGIPPSLKNIFRELKDDMPEIEISAGNLEKWAHQGVFLLNSVLTVRQKEPASHQKMGWETFTDATIAELSKRREHLVFLLWGNYAQSKISLINSEKHLVLTAPHPSPFSAHKGFFVFNHFSRTNAFLSQHNIDPIDWSLPSEQLAFSGF